MFQKHTQKEPPRRDPALSKLSQAGPETQPLFYAALGWGLGPIFESFGCLIPTAAAFRDPKLPSKC